MKTLGNIKKKLVKTVLNPKQSDCLLRKITSRTFRNTVDLTILRITKDNFKLYMRTIYFMPKLSHIYFVYTRKTNNELARLYKALLEADHKVEKIFLNGADSSCFENLSNSSLRLSAYLICLLATRVTAHLHSLITWTIKPIFIKFLYTCADYLTRDVSVKTTPRIKIGLDLSDDSSTDAQELRNLSPHIYLFL